MTDQPRASLEFETVGELLADRMKVLGVSATQLASAAGVCTNTVLRLMRGDSNTRITNVMKVARALGLELRVEYSKPGP